MPLVRFAIESRTVFIGRFMTQNHMLPNPIIASKSKLGGRI